jgi:tetratricopeptide (TPR) repeat protein
MTLAGSSVVSGSRRTAQRTLTWLFLAVAVFCSRPSQADSRWLRLRSEHFVFVGDASERNIRDVALHLEQFRDVLSRVLPPSAVATTVPTIVFVFRNDSSLTPYKPLFERKPVALSGFFAGSPDRNLIAINAAAEQSALRVIFHEYAHFLVQNTSGQLPPWANEGFAGFYETFQELSGGKSALIGVSNGDHVALLRNARLLSMRDLLSIGYTSPEYNEGNRRGVFYAESWALMHYLQLGSQPRASQLAQYLAQLHNGGEPVETFNAVFGDPAILERELGDYLRKFTFPSIRLDFAEKVVGAGAGAAETLDATASATYLADLLARTGHIDEARSRLQKILDANPTASAAAETLGVLELHAGNADRALPWLERAANDPTAAGAQVMWGRAVIERYEKASDDGSDPGSSLNDARVALASAAALRPDDAETLATFGRAESIAGEDVAKALALLDRAVALAPGQEEYRLMLAEELVRQRQFARATAILGPLTASARRPEIREVARRVMSRAATRANELAREPASTSAPAAATTRRTGPSFRVLRPNETRAVGTLTAVDCPSGTVVLHVETEDESLRLSASSVVAVQFISYHTTDQRPLACGAVTPPARVFATYLESEAAIQATGIDGRAIAIEVLPDGYEVQ